MYERIVLIVVLMLSLFGCHFSKNGEDKYKVSVDGKLKPDSENISLKDYNGIWVCYKVLEQDDLVKSWARRLYEEGLIDYRKEISTHFWFEIKGDTIIVNSLFKMPIQITVPKEELSRTGVIDYLYRNDSLINHVTKRKVYCKIEGKDGISYQDYFKKMKLDSMYCLNDYEILSYNRWCLGDVILVDGEGFSYYFKRASSYDTNIKGFPGNCFNSFVVNRVYKNCTIEEAVDKMCLEFPSGAVGLYGVKIGGSSIHECDEVTFPKESDEDENSYHHWEGENKVTVTIPHGGRTSLIFEFVKKGSDVHVKYWSDVDFSLIHETVVDYQDYIMG
ncbi:MAG: hypothetical protein N4A37_03270 [Prolixibacteraceae bacterium]|jgi:hypothetical protein|nr:hypothetical protein [Prolixibacteraceae bacterium]